MVQPYCGGADVVWCAMTFGGSIRYQSLTAIPSSEWMISWSAWGGPGSSPPWTSPSRLPSPHVPGQRLRSALPMATGNIGFFFLVCVGCPPPSSASWTSSSAPFQTFAVTYLEDVIIHSFTCSDDLFHLGEVLRDLRKAGLMANPHKCHLGLSETQYLGYCVGRGLLKSKEKKIEAISGHPTP